MVKKIGREGGSLLGMEGCNSQQNSRVRKHTSGGKARQAEGTARAKGLRLEGEKRPPGLSAVSKGENV